MTCHGRPPTLLPEGAALTTPSGRCRVECVITKDATNPYQLPVAVHMYGERAVAQQDDVMALLRRLSAYGSGLWNGRAPEVVQITRVAATGERAP